MLYCKFKAYVKEISKGLLKALLVVVDHLFRDFVILVFFINRLRQSQL